MSGHNRFCDNAGFTRHCWECGHAIDWHEVNTIDGYEAECKLRGIKVGKYDSPNNGCSNAGGCGYYAQPTRLRGEGWRKVEG